MASRTTNPAAAVKRRKTAARRMPSRAPADAAGLAAVEAEAVEAERVEAEEARAAVTRAPAIVTRRLLVDLPAAPPARRRPRKAPSLGMLVALCAYLGAILVVVSFAGSLRGEGVAVGLFGGGGGESGGGAALADMGGDDALALRTQAARVARSTAVLDTRFARGTAFVAWTIQGQSFLITALPVVQGVLSEGEDSVFVRRGQSFWNGTIERVDESRGLALVTVDADLGAPLWQQRHDTAIGDGDLAAIVRAGDIGSVQGTVAGVGQARPTVTAEGEPMNLGAPVVGPGGRVVGVVVGGEAGRAGFVPLEEACGEIRRCG
jgi:hypothetical protein